MSKKSFFGRLKKDAKETKEVKMVEPRKLPEIQENYANGCNKAGQIQYQLYVLQKELDNINAGLISLNQEAAARQELDKPVPPATPTTETTEVQNAQS